MSVTPNYNWPLIEPTDFVTNLPADFEAFGDAVDLTVDTIETKLDVITIEGDLIVGDASGDPVRLPVGALGTVLTSDGTTVSFALDPVSDLVTTKGDLVVATAGDTLTRLAVGSNDQVLTADSSTATGLKFAAPAAGGMSVIATGSLTGSSVTISSIPATFNDLLLIVRNHKQVADGGNLQMRFNGVTTNNYNRTFNNFDTTVAFTAGFIGNIAQFCDDTQSQALTHVKIPDYANTVTFKMAFCHSIQNNETTPTSMTVTNGVMGMFNQTGAINSITLFGSGGAFNGGTFILYGVK